MSLAFIANSLTSMAFGASTLLAMLDGLPLAPNTFAAIQPILACLTLFVLYNYFQDLLKPKKNPPSAWLPCLLLFISLITSITTFPILTIGTLLGCTSIFYHRYYQNDFKNSTQEQPARIYLMPNKKQLFSGIATLTMGGGGVLCLAHLYNLLANLDIIPPLNNDIINILDNTVPLSVCLSILGAGLIATYCLWMITSVTNSTDKIHREIGVTTTMTLLCLAIFCLALTPQLLPALGLALLPTLSNLPNIKISQSRNLDPKYNTGSATVMSPQPNVSAASTQRPQPPSKTS